MGWFTPKCPHCGGPLEETGYSIGCPTHRCRNCIRRNAEREKYEDELAELRRRIARMEKQK